MTLEHLHHAIIQRNAFLFLFFFFFYLGFVSRTFMNHRTAREEGGHSINSPLPLPPASQTLRHQPEDCCRELTSAHSQQPDSNREHLVSERKSLTTNLRALVKYMYSSGECFKSEANSEPRQISKMDLFTKIVHSFSPLTIFQKSSISDVRLGSEYSAEDSKPL